jgi:hypothetical protein
LGFVGGLLVGRSKKNSYLVHIGDALGSQDEAQIQEVVQALKEAIIEQG